MNIGDKVRDKRNGSVGTVRCINGAPNNGVKVLLSGTEETWIDAGDLEPASEGILELLDTPVDEQASVPESLLSKPAWPSEITTAKAPKAPKAPKAKKARL